MPDHEPVRAETEVADDEFSLLDLAAVLASNARTLTVAPLVGGLLVFGISWMIPPVYTATAQLLAPQQQQSSAAALLGGLSGLAGGGASSAFKNPGDQWVGLLQSRSIADAMVDRFKLLDRYEAEFRFEARKKLEQRSSFSAGKDGLITIQVEDTDPATSAQMASAYIEELRKLSDGLAVTEAAQRRLFFENQLKDTKDKLTQAEVALRNSGVGPNLLKAHPDATVGAIARLKAEIASNDVKLQVMRRSMTDNAPSLREVLDAQAALRSQLAQTERGGPEGNAGNDSQYTARYRDFKYYETLFEMVARQYEIARSDEAKEGAVIQVVDKPEVPEWKTKPKRAMLALAGAAAALLGAAVWTVLRHAMQTSQADPNAAEKWRTIRRGMRLRRREAGL